MRERVHADVVHTANLATVPGQKSTLGARAWSRQHAWDVCAPYEETNLSVLRSLRKRKTYRQQQSKREVFDTIDRMETGFELTSEELKAAAVHRQFYCDFLSATRIERESVRTDDTLPDGSRPFGSEPSPYGNLGLECYSEPPPYEPNSQPNLLSVFIAVRTRS